MQLRKNCQIIFKMWIICFFLLTSFLTKWQNCFATIRLPIPEFTISLKFSIFWSLKKCCIFWHDNFLFSVSFAENYFILFQLFYALSDFLQEFSHCVKGAQAWEFRLRVPHTIKAYPYLGGQHKNWREKNYFVTVALLVYFRRIPYLAHGQLPLNDFKRIISTCWIFEAPAEQWACALKAK